MKWTYLISVRRSQYVSESPTRRPDSRLWPRLQIGENQSPIKKMHTQALQKIWEPLFVNLINFSKFSPIASHTMGHRVFSLVLFLTVKLQATSIFSQHFSYFSRSFFCYLFRPPIFIFDWGLGVQIWGPKVPKFYFLPKSRYFDAKL